MFSSVIVSGIATYFLRKRTLKNKWDDYLAFANLKYSFLPTEYWRISKYVFKTSTIIIAIATITFFDWYSAFEKDKVRINTIFGIGESSFAYSDLKEIRDIEFIKAPNGDIIEDYHFVLLFKDETKWNSRDQGFSDYDLDGEIIDFVSKKSKVEVVNFEYDK